jgi:hypothetical protein
LSTSRAPSKLSLTVRFGARAALCLLRRSAYERASNLGVVKSLHRNLRWATDGAILTEDTVMEHEAKVPLKQRVIEEFKIFSIITLYLWVFLGSFTLYRRLIVDETGAAYLHYGIALIEALVIAKVILIGKMFGLGRRFDNKPLIVPVLYKTILFGILVLLFAIAEHLVEGWFHKQGLLAGLREIMDTGIYEIGARVLMLVVAFIPFFAFAEIGRVVGLHRLGTMFFLKGEPSAT